jgi:DNA-binding transcriptional ArsR family regulator
MVEQTQPGPRAQSLDRVFAALSDPTRRRMIEQLKQGEANISALATPHDMSFAAASKHVRVLEVAGLVSRRRTGREYRIRLEPVPLMHAAEWLAAYRRFWTGRLDALEDWLQSERKQGKHESE